MRGMHRNLKRLTLLLTLVGAAACTDELPVASPSALTGDENPDPAGNRSVIASVNCKADVTTTTLSCGEVPVVDGETGLQRVTLGGQNLYVLLVSSAVSYDPGTQIFQANVQVANLIQQGLGSADGINTTGVRVFHHSGPTVTSGTGTVTVANADGTGTFTGSDQPYHFYGYYIPYYYITPAKTWRWNVPTTATTFEFTVFVDADVVGENGYVAMSPTHALIATVGGTTSVVGTPSDVVGRPVPGTITYTSLDPSIATVDASTGLVTAVSSGVASIVASTGGPEVDGVTRVTVAPATGTFDINFDFLTTVTASERTAFTNAAARWASLIAGDLPTELVEIPQLYCGGVVDEYVDDLTIRVVIRPIDGPGNILGQASPCWIRTASGLPALGIMQFDSDDTDFPGFADVVLHEMGHVLGIGSLWTLFDLLSDDNGLVTDLDACFPVAGDPPPPLTTDPFFSGPLAIAAFNSAGGTAYSGNKVPVEDGYLEGTRCGHWRETILDTELMTGFAEASGIAMPLSEITVKSLADMGYTVAATGWDAFTCPSCSPPAPGVAAADTHAGGFELVNDILRLPLYSRDVNGRVIEVRRGKVDALPIGR